MAVKSHWSGEKARFALVAVFGAVIGLIVGYLWIGLSVAFICYSGWLLYQARQVDLWLQKGAKRSTAPDTEGVIGHIEQLIFRSKQSDKKRKARLKKIVGLYNQSAAALPDATVVTDHNYEIIWSNDAAKRHLGIYSNRDEGQRLDNLVRSPEFQSYLGQPQPEDTELELISPVNNKLTLSIKRVRYAENMYLFSARDVSQRVLLRATRAAFVANASHELKTPLTVVNGYLEMLAEDKDLSEQAQRKIALASQHATRMTDIVTDMLTLSRLENQGIDESKLQLLDLASLLQRTVSDLSVQPSASAHSFDLALDQSVLLLGSELEIKSICNNLCHNALQHTPAGTNITISWAKTFDNGAELIIQDDGPGINARDLPHITERFYRADTEQSRESGGTGLGLAIVKHIVQRHNGTLVIDSTLGTGTQITIRFPADQISLTTPADKVSVAAN
ncbi:phosphate regulon sensor histidine kinase PhoR [Chromatiales bacterium (ex Bugula neritina AB1)]|nr:phosphate regulon sensor histidine kinase PhoR [Chromatiales bacterium (ex Bugula neritina AB1)]